VKIRVCIGLPVEWTVPAGYQRFETKKCLVNTRRDMMIFMKCAFQVSSSAK